MATMTDYPYRPVGKNEIRLLKILPTLDLRYEVIHHNLNRRIDYAALSYRWGDSPAFQQIIYLGDHEFRITDSLHDALKSLKVRQLQKDAQTMTHHIWIDQICINQNDIQERGSQVPLMKSIYEQASKVLIWLGNPENPAQTALGIKKMEEFVSRNRAIGRKLMATLLWKLPSRQNIEECDRAMNEAFMSSLSITDPLIFDFEGTPTHAAWLGICALFGNAWWERTWVYQEATVSEKIIFFNATSSKTRFLCGAWSCTWTHVFIALEVAKHLVNTLQPQTQFLREHLEAVSRVDEMRLLRLSSNPTLLALLQSFRQSKCQNPKDKVYAPLCLAPNNVRAIMVTDYTQPLLQIYIDVVRVCLCELGHELDFLGHTMKLKQHLRTPSPEAARLDWPSWVPDWGQPLPLAPIPKILHLPGGKPAMRNGTIYLNQKQTNVYNASRGSPAEANIVDNTLHVKGVRCDIIKDLISLSSSTEVQKQKDRLWAGKAGHQYFTGENWVMARNRTRAMDVQYNNGGDVCGRNFFLETLDGQVSTHESRNTMIFAMTNSTQLRSLCLTENGFIGMVPNTAGVGDVVCALLGGQVLYTLRYPGAGDEYEYIGEAYLHGLMDGEVMEWVDDGAAVVETFVLA